MSSDRLNFFVCPICYSALVGNDRLICQNEFCSRAFTYSPNSVPILLPELEHDDELTQGRWEHIYLEDEEWKDVDWNAPALNLSNKFIKDFWGSRPQGVFLEMGCGLARDSLKLVKENGVISLGVDYSEQALSKASKIAKRENLQSFFAVGDIRSLPIVSDTVDFIYAGGSIEHSADPLRAMTEGYRVLRRAGVMLATVPIISLSMLTYGQLQANIPNIPVVKNIYEFFHAKILRGKFMVNGFELSFFQGQIERLFREAGFSEVSSGWFPTPLDIRYFKSIFLKNLLRGLAEHRLFWPMIYVVGRK